MIFLEDFQLQGTEVFECMKIHDTCYCILRRFRQRHLMPIALQQVCAHGELTTNSENVPLFHFSENVPSFHFSFNSIMCHYCGNTTLSKSDHILWTLYQFRPHKARFTERGPFQNFVIRTYDCVPRNLQALLPCGPGMAELQVGQ